MEEWKKDARRDVVITDIDALVPEDHLLRKIERVMDYDWLYERLAPYYNHAVGRPGTDPVVFIKMVLIQHLFGLRSLGQTYRELMANIAYRWFLFRMKLIRHVTGTGWYWMLKSQRETYMTA